MSAETTINITYSQTPRPCKKQRCELCQTKQEHPPYWFASTIIDGREHHLYLGTEFRPVLLDEFLKAKPAPAKATLPALPTSKEFHQDLKKFKNIRLKDIKVQYRELIKKYHPDQYGDNDEQIQEWMKIINIVRENHLNRQERWIQGSHS